MTSSTPSTTCSSPNNDSVEKVIKNDSIRYQRKGYGLFVAIMIALSYFYLSPIILQKIWPEFETRDEAIKFFAIIAWSVHIGVYTLANIIMYAIYVIKLPFFERYRILNKPWPWEEDPKKWRETLKKTLKSTFIAHFVICPIALVGDISAGINWRLDKDTFPTYLEIIGQIVFFMIVEDFSFYWVHRFLHWKKVYPYIHKTHHEYNITVSVAAEYAHPLEFILSNLIPSSLGPKILGTQVHFLTYYIWLVIRLMETVDGHSGYEFSWSPYRLLPLSGSSIYHNYHHSNNIGNFCSLFTYLDTLFGTNKSYYKYLSKKEKEVVLNELRGEFSRLKSNIDANPNEKIARLNELNNSSELTNKLEKLKQN